MYDTVQAGLISGDVEGLRKIYQNLINRVNAARKCSIAELLSAINSSESTLSRNFSVEHFVPSYARGREKKFFTAIR
jgi:hypothetical protein